MEYTLKSLAKLFKKDKSTIQKIITYLELPYEVKYYDKARKNTNFYSEESFFKIKNFLLEVKNTKKFFTVKTNLEKYGCKISSQNSLVKEKAKSTFKKKYGVENPMQNKEVLSKFIESNKIKYGYEFPFQDSKIQEKGRETCKELYGNCNYTRTGEYRVKCRETNLKKYKVPYVSQSFLVKEKIKKNRLNLCLKEEKEKDYLLISNLENILNREKTSIYHILKKLNIPYTIKDSGRGFLHKKYIQNLIDYCKITDQSGKSFKEKEVLDFIKIIYKGKIEENNKKIIFPYELDIYIPEKGIAIEFDGLFWHSTLSILKLYKRIPTKEENEKIKNRHLLKSIECEKKGIRLIHIFEDEWNEKKDICKSIIASSLGIYNQKYMARKCIIDFVNLQEYKNFLEKNHIQGYAYADTRLGLFYKNELIQVMGITRSVHKNGEVELNRMATKLNCQVVGGFSKLLKRAKEIYNCKIYSYLSRRLFDGKGYYSVGFSKLYINPPTYFYVKIETNNKRYPRYKFMKEKIKKMYQQGVLKYWDESKTEEENMLENEYGRIYDCGTIKFEI